MYKSTCRAFAPHCPSARLKAIFWLASLFFEVGPSTRTQSASAGMAGAVLVAPYLFAPAPLNLDFVESTAAIVTGSVNTAAPVIWLPFRLCNSWLKLFPGQKRCWLCVVT